MNKFISVFFQTSTVALIAVFLFISYANGAGGGVTDWPWGGSTDDLIGCGTPPCAPNINNATGIGWIRTTGFTNALAVPPANGPVAGYAWASTGALSGAPTGIGWINFQPSGPYPAPPTHAALREGNIVTGWARIVSIQNAFTLNNSGAWEGWIKLQSEPGDPVSYGVSIDTSNNLSGYAWSNELGWIHFGDANTPPPPSPEICGNGVDDDGDGLDDATDPDCSLPFVASCEALPTNPKTGTIVTWTANIISAGTPPYSYAWSLPEATIVTPSINNTVQVTYTTKGTKQATVTVTDAATPIKQSIASCTVKVGGGGGFNEGEVDPFF